MHLLAAEQIEALRAKGYRVAAGAMGENVTTSGLDLLSLCRKGRCSPWRSGRSDHGLRTPCTQLNKFQDGLMGEMIERSPDGKKSAMKAGIMAVVTRGGAVTPGRYDTRDLTARAA